MAAKESLSNLSYPEQFERDIMASERSNLINNPFTISELSKKSNSLQVELNSLDVFSRRLAVAINHKYGILAPGEPKVLTYSYLSVLGFPKPGSAKIEEPEPNFSEEDKINLFVEPDNNAAEWLTRQYELSLTEAGGQQHCIDFVLRFMNIAIARLEYGEYQKTALAASKETKKQRAAVLERLKSSLELLRGLYLLADAQ